MPDTALGPGGSGLPELETLQAILERAHASCRLLSGGHNAQYIPALAEVDPSLFGLALATADGRVASVGDAEHVFSIQSVGKLFSLALVMQEAGEEAILEKIGVEPSGHPFNSVLAVELRKTRSINPLINAGAIAAVSMLEAATAEERWAKIFKTYGRFAGEPLEFLEEVYRSESRTNHRNRGIANLLYSYGRLYAEPVETLDVYTRQCSVGVTARQLAVMGATLANGGVNPRTDERVVAAALVPKIVAVLQMTGFYDASGTWAFEAGVPAKTGVSGAVVAVVPGRLALAGFSPPIDENGHSVRVLAAVKQIARALRLSIFDAAG